MLVHFCCDSEYHCITNAHIESVFRRKRCVDSHSSHGRQAWHENSPSPGASCAWRRIPVSRIFYQKSLQNTTNIGVDVSGPLPDERLRGFQI